MAANISFSSESKVSNEGILYTTRRKFNLGDKIAELTPSETPLLTMLTKMRRVKVNDPDIHYMEHRAHWLDNITYTVSAAADVTVSTASAGTSVSIALKVTNTPATTIKAGHVLQFLDGGSTSGDSANLLVTSVSATSSTSTLVTGKLISHKPGWSMAADDKVLRIGSAFAEGSEKAAGYTDNIEQHWASCQIFKTLYGISRTLRKTKLYGGNEYQRIRSDKLREHKIDIERALIFGERVSGTEGDPFAAPGSTGVLDGNTPLRFTHGAINAIVYGSENNGMGSREFNITKANYSYADFIDDMEDIFEYGSQNKVAFCGMGVISFFNKMALNESQMMLNSKETKFGIKVTTLETGAGTLNLVWNPLLRGDYKNYMIILDMANVELAVFDDTVLETNVQTPGVDGIEEQYLSDLGAIFKLPETGAVVRFY
jgi:hypothetical protein